MTSPDWTPIRNALAQLRQHRIPVPIWCRDDDATEPSQALDQLHAFSEATDLPVHLAIIPKPATQELARLVMQTVAFVPMIHGWQHANHAPPDAKKSEFGQMRSDGTADLSAAIETLSDMFGDSLMPMFVPPWNRMDTAFIPELARAGYSGVSTFLPRDAARPHPDIVQINAHIDPIAWRSTRDLADPDMLIAHTAALLNSRAEGSADPTEPLGLLTHHLVHSQQVWSFCERLIKELMDGGAFPQPLYSLLEPAP